MINNGRVLGLKLQIGDKRSVMKNEGDIEKIKESKPIKLWEIAFTLIKDENKRKDKHEIKIASELISIYKKDYETKDKKKIKQKINNNKKILSNHNVRLWLSDYNFLEKESDTIDIAKGQLLSYIICEYMGEYKKKEEVLNKRVKIINNQEFIEEELAKSQRVLFGKPRKKKSITLQDIIPARITNQEVIEEIRIKTRKFSLNKRNK